MNNLTAAINVFNEDIPSWLWKSLLILPWHFAIMLSLLSLVLVITKYQFTGNFKDAELKVFLIFDDTLGCYWWSMQNYKSDGNDMFKTSNSTQWWKRHFIKQLKKPFYSSTILT